MKALGALRTNVLEETLPRFLVIQKINNSLVEHMYGDKWKLQKGVVWPITSRRRLRIDIYFREMTNTSCITGMFANDTLSIGIIKTIIQRVLDKT